MIIKIKALDDIEFINAKLDKTHNIIHVQARNLLDSTGKHCKDTSCTGRYIAHGYATSIYEDLHVHGFRIFIHLKTRRAYCPVCGSVVVNKPTCLARNILPDEDASGWFGNHRTTNRFLDWIEYLIFKYGVDETSNITSIKRRRLYYIRKAYYDRTFTMHDGERSLVISKSIHHNQSLYLVIDTMYDTDLLNFFNSPKPALNFVLEMKRNNPAIKKVIIPINFKYNQELCNVFGEANVQYDFRSLQTMITSVCFSEYKKQRCSGDSSILDMEEHLFKTPRTLLSSDDQNRLNQLLHTNTLFHEYYYLQHEYWYSLDDKIPVKIKNSDLLDKVIKDKNKIGNREKEKSIDNLTKELGNNLDKKERKEYILYKMNTSLKKYKESQCDEIIDLNVDQL